MKGQQSAKVIPVCPTGDMNVCKLLHGNPFSHYRATLLFLPQMSTSCCHRRKRLQEDGPSHQAVSCGDNEWLLQSIKSLLRNFRSDHSRWSVTTIALRWATLPHQGLNPRELTKDTPHGADGPGSAWHLWWMSKSLRHDQSHSWNKYFATTTTIKESIKTFATKRKSAKQIAFFSIHWETCDV